MRLDYNILWFEDIKSSFDTKKKIVQAIVEDLGFAFPEPQLEINGDNIDNIQFDDFDLIIVDLNLGKEKGSALIDRIRNHDVYTEVVFYSSEGEKAVREELRNFEIDGVYCAGRENDDFEEKVTKVIKTTVKKVQDLNNMRGLIMAETSDIDSKMHEIIQVILQKYPQDIHNPLIDKIFKEVGSSIKEKSEKYTKWEKARNISKLMGDTLMFDASKKLGAVQHIIETIEHDIFHPHREGKFAESYKGEIGETRNVFAHVSVVVEEGVKKLKSKNKEVVFTDQYCKDVRDTLRKYTTLLDQIKSIIEIEAAKIKKVKA